LPVIVYNLFLLFFRAAISVSSLFDAKAGKWVSGRKKIFRRLAAAFPPGAPVIWMHCASLGEFEQGRPVIERLSTLYPGHRILLTFFSPSGYEVRKNYDRATAVFYLPLDGAVSARRFLDIVRPSLALFVKYEFWYHYLKTLSDRHIPTLLISARFTREKPFFRWYGSLQRQMLKNFTRVFVQDAHSLKLLSAADLDGNCELGGDTRFDRVLGIAGGAANLREIGEFAGPRALVAGSTWPEDENLIREALAVIGDSSFRLILAPHEISNKRINSVLNFFPSASLFSQSSWRAGGENKSRVLIIDNIGMLSRVYKYGYVTYVGGGFRTGLHNVLEAAVFGKPVFFGPLYREHNEAVGLSACGGGIPVRNAHELAGWLKKLLSDTEEWMRRSSAASSYVRAGAGATERVIRYIQENRLLTS